MPEAIEVRKIPLHSVSDASELAALIDGGVLEADRVVAVIGKTEGNRGVNDYTRIIADRAFREVIAAQGSRRPRAGPGDSHRPVRWHGRRALPARNRVRDDSAGARPRDRRTAVDGRRRDERTAAARGDRPPPDVTKVVAAVRQVMGRAGITDPADVHYVQTTTPRLTINTIRDAESRGQTVWTEHTHESMDLYN